MSDTFTVTWKVNDGFVNNGPQETEIDIEDLAACESNADLEWVVEEAIQQDFNCNITFEFDVDEEVARAMAAVDAHNKEALK